MFKKRLLLQIILDSAVIFSSLYLSLIIRFEPNIPTVYNAQIIGIFLIFLVVKVVTFCISGVYSISWKYTGLTEVLNIAKAHVYSLAALTAVFYFKGFPRSVLLIDFLCSFVAISGLRLFVRIFFQSTHKVNLTGYRTIIVGAGDAGEQILRNIMAGKNVEYMPIGFIDDDPDRIGLSIHGVKILGPRKKIPELVARFAIRAVIVAMPSAPSSVIRETVQAARKAGVVKIKILPSLKELISGRVGIKDTKDISVEDLLERQEIKINHGLIESGVKDKVIMVTGGAGSIGSELCRKIARFSPKRLVIFDQDETGVFNVDNELKDNFPGLDIVPVVGNVRDEAKVSDVLSANRTDIVFHAAAYKHVPMMESYPEEAVKTNVFGTLNLAKAALRHGVKKVVLISTDKAVCPSSVMGATKRIAEMIGSAFNGQGGTRFLAVRFGNVLESRGNVLEIFKREIEDRQEVTITDPDMERYIITISEAVLLVLEAAAEEAGYLFTLDMGEPIKITALADKMIRLCGYEPDKDIPIVFTGIRPGEKLSEECWNKDEKLAVSKNNKRVFIIEPSGYPDAQKLHVSLEELRGCIDKCVEKNKLTALLKNIIPEYRKDGVKDI